MLSKFKAKFLITCNFLSATHSAKTKETKSCSILIVKVILSYLYLTVVTQQFIYFFGRRVSVANNNLLSLQSIRIKF